MNDPFDPLGRDVNVNFRTYVSESMWNDYFLELGKFVNAFASVEVVLTIQLGQLLEKTVSPPTNYRHWRDERPREEIQAESKLSSQRSASIRAVIGSMRLAPLNDAFNRLFHVANSSPELIKEFKRIYAQLGEIHYFRDRLVHNGAVPDMRDKENWFSTDDRHTKSLEKDHSRIYFKTEHLRHMTHDLDLMPDLFHSLFNPGSFPASDPRMKEPFLYKPSALKREGPKFAPSRQEQKPRPPTSGE